jgi:hypothetical protein
MNLGTTAARGISTTATPMTNRAARATVIAAGIKNTTSSGQATSLLLDMRDAMQTRMNNGTTNRDTLVRLAHTTKTGQEMAFQTLDKKWGNKTRTLETKAALIAEFEQAGWDTTELHEYLDTITTRQDRILESRICTILDNAAKKAEAEGPNITVDTQQITTPWNSNSIDHAPKIGEGGQASAYRLQINNEPVVVKIFDPLKLPPPVKLDPQRISPHIKRDAEVTAAFIKGDASSVVKPSLFIARVTDSNNIQTEHLVKAGKDFKEWSKEQLWDEEANRPRQNPPTIQLTGLVMPLANGKTLNHTVLETNLSFTKTAESALNALNQMANHGFVHGDIKPSNLVVKQDGDLALIDTGSMAKITKRAAGAVIMPADAYFDKASRPYTEDHTHPGHPPDFKKVGMEQDLFSMGVTLLETKIVSIAKNLAPDDAVEFLDAAQSIRDTIVEENAAPDQSSAKTIRDEINDQLNDLRSSYPDAFADGEIDCAVGFIETALNQNAPVLDREQWKGVLAGLKNTIPNAV